MRITSVRGAEAYPSWAPDSQRVAFYAVREGIGSVWVATGRGLARYCPGKTNETRYYGQMSGVTTTSCVTSAVQKVLVVLALT